MDRHGRLLIPSSIRKTMNYKTTDTFVIRAVDDELRIINLDKAVKDAQNFFSQFGTNNISLVDELIEDRRKEAKNEV